MRFFPEGKVYNFMRWRRYFAVVSALLVVGSIVLLFVPGPKLGTDFLGGTEVEVAFAKPVELAHIRGAVTDAGFSSPDVIRVDGGQDNQFMIRVEEVEAIAESQRKALHDALCFGENLPADRCPEELRPVEVKFSPGGEKITIRFQPPPPEADLDAVRNAVLSVPGLELVVDRPERSAIEIVNARENKVEVHLQSQGNKLMSALSTGLSAQYGDNVIANDGHALRVEWIGPKAGAQLRNSAIKSIAYALLLVMLYIAFRFDLRFAPGAVVALIHDALLTLGVLTIFQVELNLATVAALLTIIGYSVNDTVVVFDRVRENLNRLRGSSFETIINSSLSEMLGRTVITSLTTALSMAIFFFVGTGTLKTFAGTLVVGIVFGTYSSIYVALPLTDFLDRKLFSKMGSGKKKSRPVPRGAEGAA